MSDPVPILDGIPGPGNSFVVQDLKLVYISVTKVASTSLRWMVADLAGEDKEAFYSASGAQQSRLMTIYRPRTFWTHTEQLFELSAEQLRQISRDNGWLIFAVVRDPWSRLWSAWQSKFLVRHRFYVRHYGEEDWFPRVPRSQQDVVDDFARFVHAQPWLTDEQLAQDVHFKTQTFSVRPHGINYSRIYDLTDMKDLLTDVHTHLDGLGRDQELYLPRANETPLPMIPAVLENGVAESIQKAYQEDFDNFGGSWSVDSLRFKTDTWDAGSLEHAVYHTVANERIGDLSQTARGLENQLHKAERRVERLEAEIAWLRRPLAERAGRRLVRTFRRRPHRR